METAGNLRHQSIERLTAQQVQTTAEAVIGWWDPIATQIIAIVGESGFNSLYARSVFLTQSRFPWLTVATASTATDSPFVKLQSSLRNATPELARDANRLLMITFTDILASLIGEQLTERILDEAWAKDAHYKTSKDLKHE